MSFYRHLQEVLANSLTAWSVTVIDVEGSSPSSLGQKLLIVDNKQETYGTIGGGAIEHQVIEFVRLNRPTSFTRKEYKLTDNAELGMICGGKATLSIEPINCRESIFIYGAGHCAIALSDILAKLNFNITVIDDRDDFLIEENFPQGSKLIKADFKQLHLTDNLNSFHVVMTYGHKHDFTVTNQLLKNDYRYIGVMGSSSKAKDLFNALSHEGYKNAQERLFCPIGIKIYSHTPYEIAISIAAELISFINS
jgi:xanthine dehydrogenase accessory factor